MKILIDMNLSSRWVKRFAEDQIESSHWSSVGDPSAPDTEIMRFAREQGFVVFTHDLDFGTILATTNAAGPSVVQVRTQDVLSEETMSLVIRVLKSNAAVLRDGALITVDVSRARIRILPLRRT
jgi:predicted nuclease of predicted toxin-antitoxin system